MQIIFSHKSLQKLSLLVQCWDSDTFEEDDLIGYNLITLASLIDSPKEDWWLLLPNPNFTDELKDENSNAINTNKSIDSVTCINTSKYQNDKSDPNIENNNRRLHSVRRSSSLILLGNRIETFRPGLTMFEMLENHNANMRLSIKDQEDLDSLERLQDDTHASETNNVQFNPNKMSKGNFFKRHRRHSFDSQTVNSKETEKFRKRDFIKFIPKKLSKIYK